MILRHKKHYVFAGRFKAALGLAYISLVLLCSSCMDNKQPATGQSSVGKADSVSIPWSELNLAKNPTEILTSVRALIAADTNTAFITVDSSGRPRVRTVYTIVEEKSSNTISKDTKIWIMTRASTRKVAQLQIDPRVTLYYNDDAAVKYASIMGTATLFTDPNEPEAALFLSTQVDQFMTQYFWPGFPKDFALIRVQPQWVEFLSKNNAHGDPKTWRPQAVVFAR
jgi:general stress protein 26